MFYNLDDLPYWDVPSNRATVTKKREREREGNGTPPWSREPYKGAVKEDPVRNVSNEHSRRQAASFPSMEGAALTQAGRA